MLNYDEYTEEQSRAMHDQFVEIVTNSKVCKTCEFYPRCFFASACLPNNFSYYMGPMESLELPKKGKYNEKNSDNV